LHAKPYASFQAGSSRRYSADEDGKIECNDADDRHDLIRSGCQEQRSMRLSAVTPAARMNSRRPAHAISHKFTPPIHKIAQLFASDCGAAAPP